MEKRVKVIERQSNKAGEGLLPFSERSVWPVLNRKDPERNKNLRSPATGYDALLNSERGCAGLRSAQVVRLLNDC